MKVALVWNGDQGSSFAYSKVKGDCAVSFLLTFLKKDCANDGLLSSIRRKCDEIDVPFFWAKMKTERVEEYGEVVAELKEEYGIEAIVTSGAQGVIEDACGRTGVKVIRA
jgi:hypothetical protein